MKEQTFKALEEAGIQDTALLVKRRTDFGTAVAYFTEAGEYVDHSGEVLQISAEQAENGAAVIVAGENIGVFSFEEAGLTADDHAVVNGVRKRLPAFDLYADAEYIGVNDQGDIVTFDTETGQMTDCYTYEDYYEADYGVENTEEVEGKKDEMFLYHRYVFVDADENIVVDSGSGRLTVQHIRERLIANEDKLVGDPRAFLKGIAKKFSTADDNDGDTSDKIEFGLYFDGRSTSAREAILLNNTLNPIPEGALPQDGVRLSPLHEKQTKESFLKAHPDLYAATEGRPLGKAMMQSMGEAIYKRARLIYAGATQTPMDDIKMSMGYYDGPDYEDDYDAGESYSAREIFEMVTRAGAQEVDVPENTSVAVASIYGRAPNSGEGSVEIKMAELDGLTFMLVNDKMSGDIMYSWPTTPFLISDADYEDELEYLANPPAENADPQLPAPGQGFY